MNDSFFQQPHARVYRALPKNVDNNIINWLSGRREAVFVLLFLILVLPSYGQVAQWQWLKQPISNGKAQVKSIATDSKGSSYVVGFFTERIKLDSITLVSSGYSDLFVGKLTPSGKWAWAIAAGSSKPDQATSIALDAQGHVFVTGAFSQQMQLGKQVLKSKGETDIFLAQVSPQGQWLWATSAGGTAADWPRAVTAGSTGKLLIAGQFAEEAFFDTTKVVSRGETDAFVAQCTPTGSWQWVATAGGEDNDDINAIATTTKGDVYVTGFFSDEATFGTTHLSGKGMDDAFVGRLNTIGHWQWATAGTGSNTAYGLGLVADPKGGVFITGSFNGEALFGTHHLNSNSGDDGFVARVTEAGKWDWITTLTGNYLVKLTGITRTKQGKLCVTGFFHDTIKAGSHELTSRGKADILLGVLNTKGRWRSLLSVGDSDEDEAYGLTTGMQGQVCVGGWCNYKIAVGTTHF